MSPVLVTLPGRIAALGYAFYHQLPRGLRRWLVRRVAPTYTVGAVLLVRDQHSGKLLLVRQSGCRGWGPPAGLLARGEYPVDGARRELTEETGIVLRAEQLRPAVPNAVVHPRGQWVDLVFHATVPAVDTPLRVDGVEVREAAWHDLATPPPLTTAATDLLARYELLEARPAPDGLAPPPTLDAPAQPAAPDAPAEPSRLTPTPEQEPV